MLLCAGGSAVAEWLKNKLFDYVSEYWRDGISAEQAIAEAYLAADKHLLSAKQGFMGMGESRFHAACLFPVCYDAAAPASAASQAVCQAGKSHKLCARLARVTSCVPGWQESQDADMP